MGDTLDTVACLFAGVWKKLEADRFGCCEKNMMLGCSEEGPLAGVEGACGDEVGLAALLEVSRTKSTHFESIWSLMRW